MPNILSRAWNAGCCRFGITERSLYNRLRRARLKNVRFSIISCNCTGSTMYKDLGLPYLSPTANLSIFAEDFVKMCGDLPYYMSQPVRPAEPDPGEPPQGLLGDVRIHFVHYANFCQAAAAWQRRTARINWDNIFLVGCDRDGSTYDIIRRFDQLPYPKVFFTHKPYPEISCAFPVPGFQERGQLGDITAFRPGLIRRRYMDAFDYVSFLNGESY